MEKFDWKLTIRYNTLMLKSVGLWLEGDETYKLNLYTLYAVVSLTLFVLGHNFSQTFNIIFIYDDLEALTGTIYVSLTQTLSILKSYFLIRNMDILKQLMITLGHDVFQPKNIEQRILVQPSLNLWKTIFMVLWGMVIFAIIFLMYTFPILDNSSEERRLPFLAWYPYNSKISPFFEITYIYQIVSLLFIGIVNLSIDTLISALNMYIGAQCDILCDNLRNLSTPDINEKFRDCINHHKEILKFAENSNKFCNWIILVQFLTSAISIGLTMFQLTVVVPFSSQFVTYLFYGNAAIVEIFMYCWFGNEVEIKSKNIPYAIFESDWTDASLEVKRKLIFFVLRCQQPIKVSALNLFDLSLDIFVRILRAAWSYFALLHQVSARQ